jgi:hypothetical protein
MYCNTFYLYPQASTNFDLPELVFPVGVRLIPKPMAGFVQLVKTPYSKKTPGKYRELFTFHFDNYFLKQIQIDSALTIIN